MRTPTKRIVLANDSRLVREALHRALNKAEHLEVVQQIPDHEDLPTAIEQFEPEWVILSLPLAWQTRSWIDARTQDHSPMRFIYLTHENDRVTLDWQGTSGQELSNLSLREFIHILQEDLQPI